METQHSTQRNEASPSNRTSAWATRLLLAALLFFGSEIVLWTNSPARGLFDWALLAVGYVAMSALLLEIAARYRLRDVYGLLALAGVYGMLNGLILNPGSALSDVPRTLLTRAMGAQTVAGLLALALLLYAPRSRRARVVAGIAALVVGIAWGTWAHWSPAVFDGASASAAETLLLYGGIGAALVGLALLGLRRFGSDPSALALDRAGWAYTLMVLGGLLIFHLLRGEIDVFSPVVIVTLSIFAVMIIWFQKRSKGATLLDRLGQAPPLRTYGLVGVGFTIGGAIGYGLLRGNLSGDPLALISALFTAYGLIWLPALALVLGARAFTRQARAMRL